MGHNSRTCGKKAHPSTNDGQKNTEASAGGAQREHNKEVCNEHRGAHQSSSNAQDKGDVGEGDVSGSKSSGKRVATEPVQPNTFT